MWANRNSIRPLAVLKLWKSGKKGLDYDDFVAQINERSNYDIGDLTALLRNDQKPDLDAMIQRVQHGYRFLAQLSDLEQVLVNDKYQRSTEQAQLLIASIQNGENSSRGVQ